MAKGARKVQRAAARKEQNSSESKAQRNALKQPLVSKPGEIPDPLGGDQLRKMLLRIGLPLLGVWLLGGLIAGVSTSTTTRAFALGVPGLVTLAAAVLLVWVIRQARRARGVAGILGGIETEEDRKDALAQLEVSSKKRDVAATFAKAQLELQTDPAAALATLEAIDLKKVLPPVADEARAQRAMIHLMQGQVSLARQLADNIELKRHQDAKTRAMLTAIVSEAWARSGRATPALETLELIDPEDPLYEQLRPQIYRSYAFAYAHTNRLKDVRRVLRKLLDHDVRLLGGFMTKRAHPLLQKEARKLIEQSGQVPRKMMIQRRP